MSKATIRMCLSTTGFGPGAVRHVKWDRKYDFNDSPTEPTNVYSHARLMPGNTRPPPRFDMNLRALFTEETLDDVPVQSSSTQWASPTPSTISLLQQQTSQMPEVSSDYSVTPQPQESARSWNLASTVDIESSAPIYELERNTTELDHLIANDGNSGSVFDFDNGMNLDFNLDSTWTEGPPLFFDNFFFGGSSVNTS